MSCEIISNMNLTEKELNELAEKIIEACFDICMDREPNIISGEVFKKVYKHTNRYEILNTFKEFIQQSEPELTNPERWKVKVALKFKIVELYLESA